MTTRAPAPAATPTPPAPRPAANLPATAVTGAAARAARPRSPRVLRRLQAVAVALILVFGSFVVTALGVSLSTTTAAGESVQQYARLADAQAEALRVQQLANTWALAPSADVRGQVSGQIEVLGRSLTEAAAQGADRPELARLTAQLVRYGMSLENAFAVKGPEAAARLAQADDQLESDVLAPLETLTGAAAARMDSQLAANWLGWIIGAAAVTAVGLTAVAVALARRSHRYVNLGLAASALCVIAVAGLAAGPTGAAQSARAAFTGTPRTAIDEVTAARKLVFQARADELLSIGLRTSDNVAEQTWQAGMRTATNHLATSSLQLLRNRLSDYSRAHGNLTSLTAKGQWDEATRLVVSDAVISPGGRFETFSSSANSALAGLRRPVTSAISSATTTTALSIAGVVALTAIGAALAAWGINQRLKEYR